MSVKKSLTASALIVPSTLVAVTWFKSPAIETVPSISLKLSEWVLPPMVSVLPLAIAPPVEKLPTLPVTTTSALFQRSSPIENELTFPLMVKVLSRVTSSTTEIEPTLPLMVISVPIS